MSELNVKISNLLEKTTHYDFPFFAGIEEKEATISEKKEYIENSVDNFLKEEKIDIELQYDVLWEEAKKKASEQFDSLPDKLKINGFYLQELMHTYLEFILEKIKDVN